MMEVNQNEPISNANQPTRLIQNSHPPNTRIPGKLILQLHARKKPTTMRAIRPTNNMSSKP